MRGRRGGRGGALAAGDRACGGALALCAVSACGACGVGRNGRWWAPARPGRSRGGAATTGWRRCRNTATARAPGSSSTTASTMSPSSWTSTQEVKRSLGSKLGEMLLRTSKMLAIPQMQGHCQNPLLLGNFILMIDPSFRNQQKLLLPLFSLLPVHGPTG